MNKMFTAALAAALMTAMACGAAAASAQSAPTERVKLRVETPTKVLYEGWVRAGTRPITTPSGGTHECDGTNGGANPSPGANELTVLAAGGEKYGFTFDGSWDPEFDDFFINSIDGVTETSTEFWGVMDNYQFTATADCSAEVASGDEVLWAFNAFNVVHNLKLTQTGRLTVVVTDAWTGEPVAGATVGPDENAAGATTNAEGEATLAFSEHGPHLVRATAPQSLISNGIVLHGISHR